MPLLLLALVGVALLLPIVLVPLSLLQRYRMGTMRRQARGWVATLNVAGFTLSAVVVSATAVVTAFWVPAALPATLVALLAGALLGGIGLLLSTWEHGAGVLYFTPNRWLVTLLTSLVVLRLAYGLWRSWDAWTNWDGASAWWSGAGVAGSLAAGALLIGYGFGFWLGVRWRISRRRLRAAH